MSLLGNILWIVLGGGAITCLQYLIGGFFLCCTIVGIPFGFQCFKIGIFSLLPFGRETVEAESSTAPLRLVLNVAWLLLWGWSVALTHLVFACLCAITIIGIPFAWQHLKLTKLAVWPFGMDIRDIR